MKTIVNSFGWLLLLCATLGLAPFFPEPHLWGKLRWIDGGCIGMKPIDYYDFCVHAAPFFLLIRLIFIRFLSFFEKTTKMRFLKMLLLPALMLGFMASAEAQATSAVSKKLPADLFQKKIKTLTDEQLIDVRTPEEFSAGHLKDATNVDFKAADFKTRLEKLDKSRPVMVYCAVGGRSKKTAAMLIEMGFSKIYELTGGYNGWVKSGKDVVK